MSDKLSMLPTSLPKGAANFKSKKRSSFQPLMFYRILSKNFSTGSSHGDDFMITLTSAFQNLNPNINLQTKVCPCLK